MTMKERLGASLSIHGLSDRAKRYISETINFLIILKPIKFASEQLYSWDMQYISKQCTFSKYLKSF
jgi:hypothetical protein